jgi:hypothetical protein
LFGLPLAAAPALAAWTLLPAINPGFPGPPPFLNLAAFAAALALAAAGPLALNATGPCLFGGPFCPGLAA